MSLKGKIYPFLTLTEEFALLWQDGRMGGFGQNLMQAIHSAPRIQRVRLASLYPLECEAVTRFEMDEGWWEEILVKCRKEAEGFERYGDDMGVEV